MKDLNIIIISGYSGSGKSTALATLEDMGFYCVDNLPVELLPKFLELPMEKSPGIAGIAFVMDLREKNFPSKYQSVFESIRQKGYVFEILFIEADEEVLIQRFSQTRRQHPLAQDKRLLEGIRAERDQLQDLRKIADKIINTSHFNVHQLRAVFHDYAKKRLAIAPLNISILSFGFKYGIPHDADLIIDVRFIKNPNFIPELKPLDGEAPTVKNYVLKNEDARMFLKKYLDLIDFLLPLYEKEGKKYLTIAVGCTGGRHRSVAIARYIFEYLNKPGKRIDITHRDRDIDH